MKKILLIFLPGLGNAISLEPTLRGLFKYGKVDIYIKQKIVEILYKDSGLVNDFIYYPKFPLKKYDVIISDLGSMHWKEKIFFSLLRARRKIKYNHNPNIHERDDRLKALKELNVKIKDKHPRIYIPQKIKARIKRPAIGFHPGCSEVLKYKRWPIERFAQVADKLADKYNIYIFGGPEEETLAWNMANLMKKKSNILAGKLNILETAQAIGQCDYFITNDSGLMHIASAMKVPTIAIFGSTNTIKNAPLVKRHIILQNNDLNKISSEDVLRVIYEL